MVSAEPQDKRRVISVFYEANPENVQSTFQSIAASLGMMQVSIRPVTIPPTPEHPGAFAPKCVPSPRAFAQQKMPGAETINNNVPGAGLLHQLSFKLENC